MSLLLPRVVHGAFVPSDTQNASTSADMNSVSVADLKASLEGLLRSKTSSVAASSSSQHMPAVPADFTPFMVAQPPPLQPATHTAVARPHVVEAVADTTTAKATADELEVAVQGDPSSRVMVALEEACAELGYSLDEVAAMLRPGGEYHPDLLHLVMRKSGCQDKAAVVAALDPQKAPFLAYVEKLIRMREQEKTEQEIKVQQKIKMMGVCLVGYSWLKVSGGWRCAGGSHYLTDAAVGG